jgi:hypothetical protein
VDLQAAKLQHQYTIVRAEEALAKFIVNDWPMANGFQFCGGVDCVSAEWWTTRSGSVSWSRFYGRGTRLPLLCVWNFSGTSSATNDRSHFSVLTPGWICRRPFEVLGCDPRNAF